MMRVLMKFLLIIISVLFISSAVSAQDVPPRDLVDTGDIVVVPGQNCGKVGGDEVNRCCISDLKNFKINEEDAGNIPIVSDIARGIYSFLNGRIRAIPWVLAPDQFITLVGLPTVGTVQDAYDKMADSPCIEGVAEYTQKPNGRYQCKCMPGETGIGIHALDRLCQNIKSEKEKASCVNCLAGSYASSEVKNDENVKIGGIWTGLGCIPVSSPKAFIEKTVFGYGLVLAGLAAFLCLIYAAIQMQASRGNAEKIKKNQELLTSCIMGLMLIIFSIFILRVIGVEILRLPGLSF